MYLGFSVILIRFLWEDQTRFIGIYIYCIVASAKENQKQNETKQKGHNYFNLLQKRYMMIFVHKNWSSKFVGMF